MQDSRKKVPCGSNAGRPCTLHKLVSEHRLIASERVSRSLTMVVHLYAQGTLCEYIRIPSIVL